MEHNLKRRVVIGLLVMLMLILPTVSSLAGGYSAKPANQSQQTEGQTLYVNTPLKSKLNMRVCPDSCSCIINSFKYGTPVTVLQRGSSWSLVRVGKQTGYMATKYLSLTNPVKPTLSHQKKAPVLTASFAVVNVRCGQKVNLRAQPCVGSCVLKSYPSGTPVTILGKENNWYRVSVNGKVGYMSANYISFLNCLK